MTTPLWCLLFLACWTHLLVILAIGPVRVIPTLLGRARANAFPADTPHGPDWYRRLLRAHLNSTENLPVFAVLIVVAHLAGLTVGDIEWLCLAIAGGRVGQTAAHVASGSHLAVSVRFTFFAVQLLAGAGIVALILHHSLTG